MVWTREPGDYLAADGYTLKYYFAGPDTFQAEAEASNDGTGWTITLGAAQTTGKAAGTYGWRAYFEKGDGATLERYLFDRGSVALTADFTAANPGDLVSSDAKLLEIVEAACEGRLTADLENYQVDGTAVSKIPIERLLILRGILRAAVWREENEGVFSPSVAVAHRAPS